MTTFEFLVRRLEQSSKEDKFTKLFKDYVNKYKRIAVEPSLKHHLKRAIKLWIRIEELEIALDSLEMDNKDWYRKNMLLLRMINQWSLLQTRMGLTYTSQQYIPTGDREGKTAEEFFELEDKMKKLMEHKKKIVENNLKKRVNPGGERRPKDGPPITIKQRKKKKQGKSEQDGSQ